VPELPEVETVVRTVGPYLKGRRIVSASFSSRHVVRQDFTMLASSLAGRVVRDVTRHGKFIVILLDRGALVIHLGMTGKLLVGSAPGPYTRAVFELEDGLLVYDDIRHFGRIEWSQDLPARVAGLGPDPLSITAGDLLARLRSHRTRMKALLLNQRFLRGIGNIYADEILFLARIHPLAIASRLGAKRAAALHTAMRDVLERAIQLGGSSISDYVDAEGHTGSFQIFHQVYGRKGLPCPSCGGPIRRITVAQRGTHYCPRCQRH
jgi:formamidopyrimidine-DNA glycosylase